MSFEITSDSCAQLLARELLAWFDRAARDLPWRRTRDLYAIWISEIMLQQTQVATVIPYFERFLARLGDVAALAAASEQEVLKLWEGLGYYRRARQLHAAARQIVALHGGCFPTNYDAVRGLPGVGRYTAGAILSIGLDQRLPILEANSIRVLSRLTAFRGDAASAGGRKHLWKVAEAILPARRCGAFNQALMELGSEICTARDPACDCCPVATLCKARQLDLVERIPRATRRTAYVDATEVAVVIRHRGRVLLRQCQPGERWAGLWDFPRFAADIENGEPAQERIASRTRELVGLDIALGPRLTTIRHGVTRYRISLYCYAAQWRGNAKTKPYSNGTTRWVRLAELADYPLNTTGRKISQMLTGP